METNKLIIVCIAAMMVSVLVIAENTEARTKSSVVIGKARVVSNMAFAGGQYSGEVDASNIPHGKGKAMDSGGTLYEGNFVKGKLQGKGRRKFTDGNIYEGDFVDGLPNGKGIQVFSDGDVYEGDFVRGKPQGKGKWMRGGTYKMDSTRGMPHGTVKFTRVDGDVYEGEFADGKLTTPELGSL